MADIRPRTKAPKNEQLSGALQDELGTYELPTAPAKSPAMPPHQGSQAVNQIAQQRENTVMAGNFWTRQELIEKARSGETRQPIWPEVVRPEAVRAQHSLRRRHRRGA